MIKYVSKGDKRTKSLLDIFRGVMAGSDAAAANSASKLRSVFLKTVGERDVSAQGTSRLILGEKVASSSFSYVRLNVAPNAARRVRLDGQRQQGAVVGKYLPDRYVARRGDIETYPEIMQLSAFQFCQRFYVGNGGKLQKQAHHSKLVVINFPAIPSAKGGRRYAAYYRSNLVAHRVFHGHIGNAFRDVDGVQWEPAGDGSSLSDDRRVIAVWERFLQVDLERGGIPEVQFGERLAERLSETRRSREEEDDDEGGFCRDEPEEWMGAAGMSGNVRRSRDDDAGDTTWNSDHDCNLSRLAEDPDCYRSAVSFMDDQRRRAGGTAPDGAAITVVLPDRLNECQCQAFDSVKRHFECGGDIALHQMVFGTARTGKSWLVYALLHLLGGHVKRCCTNWNGGVPHRWNAAVSFLFPSTVVKLCRGMDSEDCRNGWQG